MSKEQTRQAIVQAFLSLLEARTVDKISVKDIVTACDISRNTFYYHYRDVYALLADIFEREAQRVLTEGAQNGAWEDALIACTRFALRNKKAVYHVYNSVDRDQLERYFFRVSDELVEQLVRKNAQGLEINNQDIRYITSFYKHAVVGIVEEWLQNDMKTPPEAAIARFSQLLDGSIRGFLERAAEIRQPE